MTTASFVCNLSNSDWRAAVSIARNAAVTAMPISIGTSQLVVCWIRISSTKIFENPAATMLGTIQQPDRLFRAAQLTQQRPESLRLLAEFLERLGSLQGEHDAGEREIEFGHVDSSPSDRRVVDVDAIAARYRPQLFAYQLIYELVRAPSSPLV